MDGRSRVEYVGLNELTVNFTQNYTGKAIPVV